MWFIMPAYILGSGLAVFGPTLYIKAIGLFLQGLFHVKITLSYTHLFELVDEDAKSLCATVLGVAVSSTLAISGIFYIIVSRDAVMFIETVFKIEAVAVILYLIVVPESPRWLLLNGQL